MIRKCASVLSALVLAAVPVCLAAAAGMVERLEACSGERDDALRLACYDREVAQLVTTARKQAAPSDVSTNTKAPQSTPQDKPEAAEDNFGIHGSEVARKRGAEESKAGTELKRLTARVTAISQRPRGELVVTLDNGQIWLQKKPQSYFPIRIGDEATITSGALGSFHLAVSGRSTQVTRIQ